ncbi:MAG TPA: hypothetical protein VM534_05675, partial [Thermoanaerobaculia bacterium]|nr:hypothetical protein [Thermoanaerobaculia bacterium]
PFPMPQIVLELLVTEEDRSVIEAEMQGGRKVVEKGSDFEARYRRLDLNAEADRIGALIDGRRTASEIAGETSRESFMVFKLLYALQVLGLVREKSSSGLLPAGREKPPVSREVSRPDESGFRPPELPGVVPGLPPSLDPGNDELFDLGEEPVLTHPTSDDEGEEIPPAAMDDETPPVADVVEAYAGAPVEEWDPESAVEPSAESLDPGAIELDRAAEMPRSQAGETYGVSRHPGGGGRKWTSLILILLLAAAAIAVGGWLMFRGEPPAPPVRPKPAVIGLPPTPGELAAVEETENDRAGEPAAAPDVPVAEEAPAAGEVTASPRASSAEEEPDALRRRYLDQAADYARTTPRNGYTVQFELVCETSSVTVAIQHGGERVWFVSKEYGGRQCFRVFWGRYPDAESAARAADEIPARLRGSNPVVLAVAEVIGQ